MIKACRSPRKARHSAGEPNCLASRASGLASASTFLAHCLRQAEEEAEPITDASLHRDARPPREPDGLPFRSHQECIAHVPSLV